MSNGTANRIAALDGVRALSIVSVMVLHGAYGRVLWGGYLGVDIFFVLSGFLITRLLIAEAEATGRIDLRDFYARRAFRILPPLIACLALAMPLRADPLSERLWVSASALGFFANFLSAERLGNVGTLWSLAIEEQFYLVWPLVFLFTFRRLRLAAAIAIGVILAAMVVRGALAALGWPDETIYSFTPARMDAIMVGCLLAIGERALPDDWQSRVTQPIGYGSFAILLVCLAVAERTFMSTSAWAFTAFELVVAAFLFALIRMPAHSWLNWVMTRAPMVYIGQRSYGIYLYHYPVFHALEALRVPGSFANFLLVAVLKAVVSLAVAEISWRLIEQPAMRFKRRFAWRRPVAEAPGNG